MTSDNEMPRVEQCDRDAAKALLDRQKIYEHTTGTFRAWDATVHAFARHRIANTHSPSPMSDTVEAMREEIARIIDPRAFDDREALKEGLDPWIDACEACDEAIAKANAILTAIRQAQSEATLSTTQKAVLRQCAERFREHEQAHEATAAHCVGGARRNRLRRAARNREMAELCEAAIAGTAPDPRDAALREAMRDHLGIESGPNGRGEMRVVVHLPVGKEQALFELLNRAALEAMDR
jgi:hypothetical protein